jgi:YfiH family protein
MPRPALPHPFTWVADVIVGGLPGATVAFTGRAGGVSDGPYASLNLGPWTEDDPAAVAENRRRAGRMAGRPLAGVRQVHGTVAHTVIPGRSDPDAATPPEADAIVAVGREVAPTVLTADCLPVLLAGGVAVAAVHAGWRGLADGVVGAAVDAIRAAGDEGPLCAAVGPCARGCCYEVGEEVHDAFGPHGVSARRGRCIDLPQVAAAVLADHGVDEVHDVGLCTMCAPAGLFFSHRRDDGTTGRQAGIAWLN